MKESGMEDAEHDRLQRRRFEEAVLPHVDSAYNLARWLARNDQDAEDLVQDAVLRAFKSFDGFRGGEARPWLLAIVRNVCYTWLSRHRQADVHTLYDDEIHGAVQAADASRAPDALADPAAILERSDSARVVNAALARLPVGYREVIVLRDLEELSYKEIASAIDIPIGTVMSRLSRGRRLLLVALQESEREG
ncbi:MAG: sigma-70 family RNA polymerase sigma factor [Betaproteobacteria bacterium]